jgi:uncharacterized protein YecT (DUF1311 family)
MKPMLRVVLLLTIFLATTIVAQDKEPTLVEAKTEFGTADRLLNEAWAEAKKALDPKMFAEIQTTQREWLEFRDERAMMAAENVADKETAQRSPSYFTTAADLTKDRAGFLRGVITQKETGLTGVWDDGFGGTVELVGEDNRILFIFHVVRGHTSDLGMLAGLATWNERLGWFSDKGRYADKTDETNICFIRRGWKLEVVSANASYYLGKRAFFDGNYYKTSPLDEKEQAIVIKAAESGVVSKD